MDTRQGQFWTYFEGHESQGLEVFQVIAVRKHRRRCVLLCIAVFTPLRVGWPPTPQVYFGP